MLLINEKYVLINCLRVCLHSHCHGGIQTKKEALPAHSHASTDRILCLDIKM